MTRDEVREVARYGRRRVLQAGATGALAGMAGCSVREIIATPPDESEGSVSTAETTPAIWVEDAFTVAQAGPPNGLDPLRMIDRPSRLVISHLFEGLYEYEGTTAPRPRLAAGAPSVANDAHEWTVELRTEPRFQNGSPVRARDVKYSFEAPITEDTRVESELDHIDQVTVIDERTVQFDLERPRASFIHTLTHPIVPKEARTDRGTAFNETAAIGSGPYELAGRTEREIRLRRCDDYWGDATASRERLRFVSVPDSSARVDGLRAGSYQVGKIDERASQEAVRNLEGVRLQVAPRIAYFYFGFNCKEGPTTDPQVREAVDYTFSMEGAVAEVVNPEGVRQYSPIPRPVAESWDLPLEKWEAIPHEPDVDEARRLFEAAGVPDDYPWRIIVPPDDTREELGRVVAEGLRAVGFTDVTVTRLEWGAMLSRYTTGRESDYNLFVIGWKGVPDPDGFTYPLFARTPRILGTTNGTFYGANSDRGKQVAEKVLQARETTNRDDRRELYADAVTTALEDRAHLPAYTLTNSFAFQEGVEDVTVTATKEQLNFLSE